MTLEQKIKTKIKEDGAISFSEFMKFALYDETEGFYSHGGAGRKKTSLLAQKWDHYLERLSLERLINVG